MLSEEEVKQRVLEMLVECPHTDTKWNPDRPDDPGCEDGYWVCLSCGAQKQKAYRPILESWKGGMGQVPRFPMLRKVCRTRIRGDFGAGDINFPEAKGERHPDNCRSPCG